MEPRWIQAINREIYRRFPELTGKPPKVKPYRNPKGGSLPGNYLLIYSNAPTAAPSADRQISFSVRVVADERGRILKITTSH
jgi:hypothetical protein